MSKAIQLCWLPTANESSTTTSPSMRIVIATGSSSKLWFETQSLTSPAAISSCGSPTEAAGEMVRSETASGGCELVVVETVLGDVDSPSVVSCGVVVDKSSAEALAWPPAESESSPLHEEPARSRATQTRARHLMMIGRVSGLFGSQRLHYGSPLSTNLRCCHPRPNSATEARQRPLLIGTAALGEVLKNVCSGTPRLRPPVGRSRMPVLSALAHQRLSNILIGRP